MADILVVDDEKEWRSLAGEMLAQGGHCVREAEDGISAFCRLKERMPDLVVLDIRMSTSGRDLMKSIKRLLPGMSVILFSAYAGYRDDPDFARADGFVEKGTDLSGLLRAVERVLEKKAIGRCGSGVLLR